MSFLGSEEILTEAKAQIDGKCAGFRVAEEVGKLEHDDPPTLKQRKKNTNGQIILHPCCNFLEFTLGVLSFESFGKQQPQRC